MKIPMSYIIMKYFNAVLFGVTVALLISNIFYNVPMNKFLYYGWGVYFAVDHLLNYLVMQQRENMAEKIIEQIQQKVKEEENVRTDSKTE